mmetsp:Transcript_17798/g.40177  ORF Transcript_17798/g.40177 Transcript_17798/m.40177 type:complete len:179 (-) Transcript_17798:210-746(-)
MTRATRRIRRARPTAAMTTAIMFLLLVCAALVHEVVSQADEPRPAPTDPTAEPYSGTAISLMNTPLPTMNDGEGSFETGSGVVVRTLEPTIDAGAVLGRNAPTSTPTPRPTNGPTAVDEFQIDGDELLPSFLTDTNAPTGRPTAGTQGQASGATGPCGTAAVYFIVAAVGFAGIARVR